MHALPWGLPPRSWMVSTPPAALRSVRGPAICRSTAAIPERVRPPCGCRNSMFAGGAQAGCLRRKGGYTGPCSLIGAPHVHQGPCGAFPPWYGLAARGAVVEGPGKSKGMGFCTSCSLRAVREDQLQTWHPHVLPTFRADSSQVSSTTSGVASN